VPHLIETAPTARSKCRGCGNGIAQAELRFGERLPNPFGGGEMTLWFHLRCAAYKRPEPFLEVLAATEIVIDEAAELLAHATRGLEFRRLPRIDGVELTQSARARCRCCHEPMVKGDWRIPLVFFEEGLFNRRGFIHARCAPAYFETFELLDRLQHFNPELTPDDLEALRHVLASAPRNAPLNR